MSSFACDKCGKECRDKRGLAIHYNKCGIDKHFICEYCKQEFTCARNLSVHSTRCKTLKTQKELTIKEELATLQCELQASKTEIARLLYLQQEAKDEIKKLQHKNKEIELMYKDRLKEQSQTLQEKYRKELADLKTALRIDLEQQLKIRDNDVSSIMNDYNQLKSDYKVIEVKNEMLEKENKSLNVDKQTLTELNARLSLKDTNTTNIINQNDNRIQLNCLEASMIQGRINPPEYVIGNVNDFMRMLRSLGIRNSYRVNDKSRGTLSWHKPGEGEIRDPKGDQMLDHIINVLTPDIIQEKSYYEEELKYQYELDDPDVYLINVYKTFVNFCKGLLQKDPNLLKQIKRELIKQGKAKNDNDIDPICEISYNKLITSISIALFPVMDVWITKSFYELGRFLGPKISRHYHTEGASREMLYIVAHSDANYSHQIHSEKLMELLREALDEIIVSESVEKIIENLINSNTSFNTDQVKKMLSFLNTPSLEDTREIMRGIVSL